MSTIVEDLTFFVNSKVLELLDLVSIDMRVYNIVDIIWRQPTRSQTFHNVWIRS